MKHKHKTWVRVIYAILGIIILFGMVGFSFV